MAETAKKAPADSDSLRSSATLPSLRYQDEIRAFKLAQCEKAKECVRQETKAELASLNEKLTQDARPKLEKCCKELGITDFDAAGFLGRFYKATESVLQDPNIPQNAKERFRHDVASNLDALFSVSKEDVMALRDRWTNSIQGAGDYASKDPSVYFVKILDARVASRIETAGLALKKAFSDGQVKPENGKYSYHPEAYDLLVKGNPTEEVAGIPRTHGIQEIDAMMPKNMNTGEKWLKGVISGGSRVEPFSKREIKTPPQDIASVSSASLAEALFDDLHKQGYKVRDEARILELCRNGNPTSLSYSKNSPLSAITDASGKPVLSAKDGSPLDAMSLILEYSKAIHLFQGRENEIREVRKDASEKEGIIDATKRLTGKGDLLKSDFHHISLDIESKIENAPVADIMITGRGLLEILPYFGDLATGNRAYGDLYYGIESDGKKTSKFISSLELMASALGIIGIGAAFTSLGKSERFMQIEKMLASVMKALPKRIRALEESGKNVNGPLKAIQKAISAFTGENTARKVASSEKKMQAVAGETQAAKTITQQESRGRTLSEWRSADLPQAMENNKKIQDLAKAENLSEDIIRKREAIRYIEQTLGISLSPKEKAALADAIIAAHNVAKGGETLGKYGQKSLAGKMSILRNALEKHVPGVSAADKELIVKNILKQGYAGAVSEFGTISKIENTKELSDLMKKSGEWKPLFEQADISMIYSVAQNPPIHDSAVLDAISAIGNLKGKSPEEVGNTLVRIGKSLDYAWDKENTMDCLRAFFSRSGDPHADVMRDIVSEMSPELRAKINKTLDMLHIRIPEKTIAGKIRESIGGILQKNRGNPEHTLSDTALFLDSLGAQTMDSKKWLAVLGSLMEKIPAETLIANISSSRNSKLKAWIESAFVGLSWEKWEIPSLLKMAETARGKTATELRKSDSAIAISHPSHYIKIVGASSESAESLIDPLRLAYNTYAHDLFFKIQRDVTAGVPLSTGSRTALQGILDNTEFRSSKLEGLYTAIRGILQKKA